MSMSITLTGALTPICPRIFPKIAPENTARPYITWQRVGGEPVNFIDATIPSKKNARVQVNVWADTELEAEAIAEQVEDALRITLALQTTVLGSPIGDYETETKLHRSMQDFSFWT